MVIFAYFSWVITVASLNCTVSAWLLSIFSVLSTYVPSVVPVTVSVQTRAWLGEESAKHISNYRVEQTHATTRVDFIALDLL